MKKVITVCPYCAAGCKLRLVVEEEKSCMPKRQWAK
ncbi:hypothetical protein DMH17_12780 [Raoultella planticola]|nr:hypothetical protein [Raoultella planticola]